MNLDELTPFVGKSVRLRFMDGQIVKATVMSVFDDPPLGLVYELEAVENPGSSELARIDVGSTVRAFADDLAGLPELAEA